MLRAVENAGFEAVGGRLRQQWIFRTGTLEGDRPLGRRELARLMAEQELRPVAVLQDDDARTWWMAGGLVYVERSGLSADDVAALLAERADRAQRRLERAHALRSRQTSSGGGASAGSPARSPHARPGIPRDLRLVIWQRDGGRCTACGGEFDLQYDHIIPVALGGATSEQNLQLLCGACNQRKGSAIA
ncbi:MAG: HNH endonuclease [Solirubrobacteraceae bacterium]|nr:HNH endonuclease [Solirubrobacteraceae bacterium]